MSGEGERGGRVFGGEDDNGGGVSCLDEIEVKEQRVDEKGLNLTESNRGRREKGLRLVLREEEQEDRSLSMASIGNEETAWFGFI